MYPSRHSTPYYGTHSYRRIVAGSTFGAPEVLTAVRLAAFTDDKEPASTKGTDQRPIPSQVEGCGGA